MSPNLDVVPVFQMIVAISAERAAERAAVVAWLLNWQGTMDDRITHDDMDHAISCIERGDHRCEGDE